MKTESRSLPFLSAVPLFRPGRYVLSRLVATIGMGRLIVHTPSGERIEHVGHGPGPTGELHIRRWRALRRLLTGGDVGFAEAYVEGDWSSPDLPRLIELASVNIDALDPTVGGSAWKRLANRLRHLTRANTKAGSRRNIAFHYDLGNDFYRLWLDAGMSYSSALYQEPTDTLEQAQQAKLDRVAERLDLGEADRVLEIGCGWGGLAVHLAKRGASVTGLTLSQEQLTEAQARAEREGVASLADLRLQDYRDVGGSFDRVVSIEMFEAVGEPYWPVYFETLRQRLAPGGRAVLQVITLREDRFERYRKEPDFIQRYIFPGGMLPTKPILIEQAARAGLTLRSADYFGESYARTLAEWRRRFLARGPEVEALGFSPRFRRLWDYYLSYCEAGFRTGAIDVGLYTFE